MIYVLLGTGFEEMEALTPVDLLRRAGMQVRTVGLNGKIVYGSHQIGVEADILPDELNASDAEMIVVPGGLGGVESIRRCSRAMEAIQAVYENGKLVAAICAGPTVLADLGIMEQRKATCYPTCRSGMSGAHVAEDAAVVRDGNIITGTSAGCAVKFSLALIEALAGEETARQIREQIVIR